MTPGRTFGHARGYFGARARVWARGRAIWRSGTRLCTRAGIFTPGRAFWHSGAFGHKRGHFGTQVHIWTCICKLARARLWARRGAIWRSGVRLGTRAGILAPGRVFGHSCWHFDARMHAWARGRAFWRPDVHSDFNLLCYQSNLESILTPRLQNTPFCSKSL